MVDDRSPHEVDVEMQSMQRDAGKCGTLDYEGLPAIRLESLLPASAVSEHANVEEIVVVLLASGSYFNNWNVCRAPSGQPHVF